MDKDSGTLHEARFLSLVLSLHGSAWMALGKVANPMTGKVERDLDAARGSIDLLETLRVKTRGNLTKEEEKMLANALSALQLNFIDEAGRVEGGDTSRIPDPGPPDGGANPKPRNEKAAGAPEPDTAGPGSATTGDK